MGACAEKHAPYDPSQDDCSRHRRSCASSLSYAVAPSECAKPSKTEAPNLTEVQKKHLVRAGGALERFMGRFNTNRITRDYSVELDKVGEGTFGIVRKGTRKGTSITRAIKTLSKKEMRNIKMFRQEIEIMKPLDHPNIVRMFEVFEDSTSIYLVMEFCQGGELFDRIIEAGHFDEGQTAIVLQQMFRTVFYLHSNFIAHRDLKPENFLLMSATAPLEENCLKLIDFGYACRFVPGRHMRTKAGTPFYMSPQVLSGKYNHLCDTWSCGAIMYTLLCGYPPFNGRTDRETIDKIRNGTYVFKDKDWRHVSDDAKDLIGKLMTRSSKTRFTAEQALNHTWVKNSAPRQRALDEVEGFNHFVISERMRRFCNKNRLKRAALQVIATEMDDRRLKELREIFTVLDARGDGMLTIDEMKEATQRAGFEIPQDLDELMAAADIGGNGCIDYSEFLATMLEQRDYLVEGAVKSAFTTFDAAGRGKIARQDLAKILDVGKQDDAVQAILQEVDKDGDGISFDDFLEMMQSTPHDKGEVHCFVPMSCGDNSDIATLSPATQDSEAPLEPVSAAAPAEN